MLGVNRMALSAARPARARRVFDVPFAGRLAAGARADVLIVGALVALAGAVRWPNLLLSPQFPSVGDTIIAALEMAEGRAFYLHDSAPYLGAPFVWLLALAYRVFGPSLEVTLLVPWALGALTVVPTYLLGRELAGRMAGLFAAALLATAGAHVVVSSHVVLSHSLTPLCSTFTLWLLARAVVRGSGRSLALAGLGAGISLQTHPTVLPLLAGSAVAVLLVRPAWLRTRWPYLALALVVVGYSTLLANHVLNCFEVVADIAGKQDEYYEGAAEAGEAADRGLYLTNLASLSVSLARMASGELDERESRTEYLSDPWVLSYPVLAVLGALIAARRGNPLLLVALAVAVFWPPLLSGKYKPVLDGRYLMPDLPVIFVDVAVAFGALAGLVMRGAPALRAGGCAALLAGAVALTLHPLGSLERFYEESQEDGFSNALYLRTMDQVQAARQGGEPVLLDPQLANVKSTGGGKASSSFAFLFALARIPSEPLDTSVRPGEPAKSVELAGKLAILHRATADRLDDTMRLDPLDGKRHSGKDSPNYRAYRIGTVSAGPP
jgi:4-amino-4-deoxy-L-arabinose transferase-like glycosyltransferase